MEDDLVGGTALIECETLAHVLRPVVIALDLAMLLRFCEIYDYFSIFLDYHSPEILLGFGKGPLSSDKCLVIDFDGGVYEVGIDVGV